LKYRWIPSLYREKAVIKIQTKNESYALKPYIRSDLLQSKTIRQIEKTADHILLLMKSGYSYMPNWLYTDSGRLWVEKKGRPFYITEWINGRGLAISEDYEKLGRAIAAIETVSNDLPRIESASFTHKQIRLRKSENHTFHRRMAKADQSHRKYQLWYRKYGKACKKLADLSWVDIKDPGIVDLMKQEWTRPVLTHRDITCSNVIISDDGRLFIIDWDRVKIDSLYSDLARTLMNTTHFNPAFIQSFLKGFEEIRPLNRSERKLIAALYRLPREAWIAARFLGQKRGNELLDIIDTTWTFRLEAINILDEWANQ